MRFDVVIGNPPYQGSDGQSQIYPKFIINSLELTSKYTTMIVPTRWFNGYSTELNTCRHKLLKEGIKELIDYTSAKDVFDNVQIMGGVCYYLTEKGYQGDCKVINYRKGNKSQKVRKLTVFDSDIIIRDNMAVSILEKVKFSDTFEFFVHTKDVFKIPSTEKGLETYEEGTTGVYITGNDPKFKGGVIRYIKSTQITDDDNLINKNKVFLFAASDNMLSFPFKVINKPIFGPPGIACNQSFIVCGPFDTKEICENVIRYLSTKFARALIHTRKMSQNTSSDIYKFVPLVDLNQTWTDEKLYKFFGLQSDEIDYIETNFKEI